MTEQSKSRLFFIFVFYLALSILATWPLAISFNRYPLFDHLDINATIYNFWWQYYAMFDLKQSPWFNPIINYPDGYSMVFYPLYLSYGILSFPFQALAGTPRAIPGCFHWISILSFALTGWLGFLLFQKLSNSKTAGIVAGILFTFLPFHFWHLPRCHTSCLELVLLPIYFYFRLLDEKKLKNGIYFGLALVPLFYQSPNYLVYLTIFFGLNLIYLLATDRKALDQKCLGALLLSFALAIFLSLPYLMEVIRELLKQTTPALSTLEEQTLYSADLLGLVLPGFNQKIYAPLGRAAEILIGPSGVSGKEIFPGYLLLGSGLAGIFLARKKVRDYGFWLLILLACLILSLGPYLNLAGHTFYHFPLPYFYLRKIFPFFEMDRSPVRIVIFSLLALAVFSAGFFRWLEEKIPSRKKNLLFLLIAAAGLMELNQAPIKVDRVPLPRLYQEIAQEPDKFTVLDLPLLPDIYRYSGFFQISHKKYLAIDLTARKVGAVFSEDPLFFYLDEPLRFFELGPEKQGRIKEQIRSELKRRKVKYVIIYLKFVDPEKKADLDRLLRGLGPEKDFASEDLFRVYQFRI